MIDFNRPNFNFGIQIIESEHCMQTWQLNDFTKELMGNEWVKKFDAWAEYALPKQPACYMMGDDKMIVHPSMSQAIRDDVELRNRTRWRVSYGLNAVKRNPNYMMANCLA